MTMHVAAPLDTHAILRARLLNAAGVGRSVGDVDDVARLRVTQWNRTFERLQRNRLVMGAFRYGDLIHQPTFGTTTIESAIQRAKLYLQTGNLEHLVDVANLAMVEFDQATRRGAVLQASDDGIHAQAAY
jgi:hypothetical protein